MECSRVEKDLRELLGDRGQLAFNKRIVVPKTMIVGKKDDDFRKLGLFTSLEKEDYQVEMAAQVLGYASSLGITHRDIPIEELIGRKHGECSILLDSINLAKFYARVFSQRVYDELGRKNAIVGYCLGGTSYFCAESTDFRLSYEELIGAIRKEEGFDLKK